MKMLLTVLKWIRFSQVLVSTVGTLSLDIQEKFSRILIYGVVPCPLDTETVFSFVEKGMSSWECDGLAYRGFF